MYEERNKFMLIGLTGRTGAGCSKVAEILGRKTIEELDLKAYKTCAYNNADERKYSFVYRYMKESKSWKNFIVIEVSSIIFSCLYESDEDRFKGFFDSLIQDKEISDAVDKEVLRTDIWNTINGNELPKVDSLKTIKDVQDYLDKCKKNKTDFKNITQNVRLEGKTNTYNFYTYFLQEAGNNLRKSGKYYDAEYRAGNETTVVKKVDELVEKIRELEEGARVCIDALRSPVEIIFFRDRYRAFYAWAVNTEDFYRQNRLGLNEKELKGLDDIEYPDKNSTFFHQDIGGCLGIADVYLYNPNTENFKFYELTEQILKYIALSLKPGLVAPTHLERCMQLAFNAKYNSGCISRQVGAVVTDADYSVKSVGWNDVPKGQVPCNLRCVEDFCRNKDEETFSEYELSNKDFMDALVKLQARKDELTKDKQTKDENIEKAIKGQYFAYCFKDVYECITGKANQVHTRALHAEENSFLQIAKYGGTGIVGGKLFTTASPCELCSKKAYQLGIREIYYIDPYPGISKKHILSFGKSGNPEMILFKGAIGNAYISLYSPRLSAKDEHELITGINVKELLGGKTKKDLEKENKELMKESESQKETIEKLKAENAKLKEKKKN